LIDKHSQKEVPKEMTELNNRIHKFENMLNGDVGDVGNPYDRICKIIDQALQRNGVIPSTRINRGLDAVKSKFGNKPPKDFITDFIEGGLKDTINTRATHPKIMELSQKINEKEEALKAFRAGKEARRAAFIIEHPPKTKKQEDRDKINNWFEGDWKKELGRKFGNEVAKVFRDQPTKLPEYWQTERKNASRNHLSSSKWAVSRELKIFEGFPWAKVPINAPTQWPPDIAEAWKDARKKLADGLIGTAVGGLQDGGPAPAQWSYKVKGQVCLKLK
jgi:hypothetical protein